MQSWKFIVDCMELPHYSSSLDALYNNVSAVLS